MSISFDIILDLVTSCLYGIFDHNQNQLVIMATFSDLDLSVATNILRGRLTRPAVIDTRILSPIAVDDCSLVLNYYGRFAGYFILDGSKNPAFILFGRSVLFKPIDHVFLFSINSESTTFPKLLKDDLQAKFQSVTSWSTINIRATVPRFCYLSLLILSTEFAIGPRLFDEPSVHQVIDANNGVSLVPFDVTSSYPECPIFDREAITFREKLERIGIKFLLVDIRDAQRFDLKNCDIFRMIYEGHSIYGLHYKAYKSVMLLLTHSRQIGPEESVKNLVASIKRSFAPVRLRYVGSTRYYGSDACNCNGLEVLTACLFALWSPQIVLKHCDLRTIFTGEDFNTVVERNSQVRSPSDEPFVDVVAYDDDEDDTITLTSVRFDGIDGEPEILSIVTTPASSQTTVILSQSEIARELEIYVIKLGRQVLEDILMSPVPPVFRLEATDDRDACYLERYETFINSLEYVVSLWCKNVTFSYNNPISIDNIREGIELPNEYKDYIIYPIIDSGINALFVICCKYKVWGYIDPSNIAAKDTDEFTHIKSLVHEYCSSLDGYEGRSIMLTSHFHKDLPRTHLILAAYHLGRLFRYSIRLPKKIIYSERDFRRYCYEVCLRLQLANNQYNLDNNLIKINGYPKTDALVSYSSPVDFERSVVPSDQCAFCLKRYCKNLGRHMKMAHDDQAMLAYNSRFPDKGVGTSK